MRPTLEVKIGSLVLPNPVGVASGCFGYGQEYADLLPVGSLGALFTKAVTLEPRTGNPPPRLAETPKGLLNSIGLANPGLRGFVEEKLPYLGGLGCPVFVNVAGSTQEEYEAVVEGIEEALAGLPDSRRRGVDGYEINVSCPNVDHGGMSFGTDPTVVERLTVSLRGRTKRPLVVKLSPNVTDIAEIGRAAEAGGADALTCINTLVGMSIDVERCVPSLPRFTGGLSGPAIRPVGVACTWKTSRAVSIPVIGLGGISSGRDALEYLLAGAAAVQIGTALFAEPRTPALILAEIVEWMERRSVPSVDRIRSLLRT